MEKKYYLYIGLLLIALGTVLEYFIPNIPNLFLVRLIGLVIGIYYFYLLYKSD